VDIQFDLHRSLGSNVSAWLGAEEALWRAAQSGGGQAGFGVATFQLTLDGLDDGLPPALEQAAACCVPVDETHSVSDAPSTDGGDASVRLEGVDQNASPQNGSLVGNTLASAARKQKATEFLRHLFLETGDALMRRSEDPGETTLRGPDWHRYERGVRRSDSTRVGSHLCAVSPEGVSVALRSSRMQVLVAAMELLDEVDEIESDQV